VRSTLSSESVAKTNNGMSYCLYRLSQYIYHMKTNFRAGKRQGRKFGKAFRKGVKRQRSYSKKLGTYRIARGGLRL
jgi:hypothetical protein